MYTKCVLTVPLTTVDADFDLNLKNVMSIIGGTMYTKCVLTVPLTTVDADFALNLKKVMSIIGGTMYTKCVLTVPLTTVDADFALNLKTVTNITRGSTDTKLVLTFLLLESEEFSFEVEKRLVLTEERCIRNCIDRSSYYSRCRFCLELEKSYEYYWRNDTKCVLTVPLNVY